MPIILERKEEDWTVVNCEPDWDNMGGDDGDGDDGVGSDEDINLCAHHACAHEGVLRVEREEHVSVGRVHR